MYYYLSLGTNIEPEVNALRMLEALCSEFGKIICFPFIYSEPEAIKSKNRFLNSAVIIICDQPITNVKARLNQIETQLGRDRTDPDKSIKDRTADIDIVTTSDRIDFTLFHVPQVSYISNSIYGKGKLANLGPLASTKGPTTIDLDRDTGNIRVIHNTQNSLIDGQESSFSFQQSLV